MTTNTPKADRSPALPLPTERPVRGAGRPWVWVPPTWSGTRGATTRPSAGHALLAWLAAAVGSGTRDTLVVLSFRGGFDGLSAVVPGAEPPPVPRSVRPVSTPTSRLLPLDSTFGLHPAMAPLLPLWKAGPSASSTPWARPRPPGRTSPPWSRWSGRPDASVRTGWSYRRSAPRAVGTGAAGHAGR